MDRLKIAFKMTTRELSCQVCGNNLKGQKGFVNIRISRSKNNPFAYGNQSCVNLCPACWEEKKEKIDKRFKSYPYRKKAYTKLVRNNVLRKLR